MFAELLYIYMFISLQIFCFLDNSYSVLTRPLQSCSLQKSSGLEPRESPAAD